MKTKTGYRIGMALVIFALSLGIAGFPGQVADAGPVCYSYGNCEWTCAPLEEACVNGTAYPDCGGDYTCCSNRLRNCWACCYWY